ncbi:CATRA conflict system CASPASE/TPR repeat-associated protein [Micromonospora sp. WMMD712]|uniref:CATRA conflict system CASPASE/TPR repeat-associated protein n=1 Tax=Micromonospora sp. WMMD712 TaxID=3016096 RepID=UPI00249B7510|nr:CATRA conflict system CASPASE/TPR repeat-associated protein [Micromonospora sp. WMMD712]WFE56934.1 BN6_48550 family protein [Micromonospora sp. WMMD712]
MDQSAVRASDRAHGTGQGGADAAGYGSAPVGLHAYALHVYTYFDGIRHSEVAERITAACRTVGMVERGNVPFVGTGGIRTTQLLSAPREGIWQALRYASPRLDAFLVCLSPEDGSADWPKLDREWRRAMGPGADEDCIGRVRLFYALYDGDAGADQLATVVAAVLPAGLEVRPTAPTEPRPGFYLWELAESDDDRLERTVVLVAPTAQEAVSDAWVWPTEGDLRPLPGYLWQMAKARHEARRFAEHRSQDGSARLYELASRFERYEQTDPEPGRNRERMLRRLQRETALAAAGEARLRAMCRTIEAAAHEARIWLEYWAEDMPVHDKSGWVEGLGGPVGRDQEYVAWLATEVNDAAELGRNTVAYAQPMAQIGSVDIEQRLREIGERSESRTALYTSVIASVSLLLAAVQSLNYEPPMYASLRSPLVASVAAGGLFLSLAAALRSTTRLRRRIWVGFAAAGFAASVTWSVGTWLVRWQTAQLPSAPVSIAASAAAAAVTFGAWLGWRARRSRHEL